MDENFNISPEEIEKIKQIYEEEEKGKTTVKVKPFPIEALPKIDITSVPLIDHIITSFANILQTEIVNIGLEIEDIKRGKIEFTKYKNFADKLEEPYYFVVYRLKPLPSYGILAFKVKFLLNLVGLLLGGSEPLRLEKEIITDTEFQILRDFFDIIFKSLEEEINKFFHVEIELVGASTDKYLSKFNFEERKIMLTEFLIKFPEEIEVTETFYLIFDKEIIDLILEKAVGAEEEEGDFRKTIWQEIRDMEIEINVKLHAPPTKLEKILSWKEGDFILLDEFANKPVKAYIENIPILEGYLGKHKSFLALMFLRWLNQK
jgi:flagellar motor switch protein FliM